MNLGTWRIIQEMSKLLSGLVLVLVSSLNGILLILDGRNLRPTTCFLFVLYKQWDMLRDTLNAKGRGS